MLRDKFTPYLSGILIGVILSSVIIGLGFSAYKQRGRIKNIIKACYYHTRSVTKGEFKQQDRDVDKGGEIKLYIDPQKEIGKINPLLYGSNLSPQSESEQHIIDFVKSIGITCFRFPGGESPGYHWKNGVFDIVEKFNNSPLAKIDYLVEFCRRTNTKLIIQVNVESGTSKEAAEWVEYMNEKVNFPVEYWELGNEVYGDWDKAYMSADKYAKLIEEYAIEMKKADPNIKIGMDWAPHRLGWDSFNNTVVKKAGKYIDFVSCHWYPNHIQPAKRFENRIHPTPKEVMANYLQIPEMVNRIKDLFAKYVPKKTKEVEITFLEWDGAWDGPSYDAKPYTQEGIAQWSLANAIFHADALGEFAKNNISVSTQFHLQSTMFGLIAGWSKEVAPGGYLWNREIVRPKALAMKLFSQHFGDILIEAKVEDSPYYYKSQDWWPDSYAGKVPYITCYASKSSQIKKIFLILINKHENNNYKVKIHIESLKLNSQGNLFVLNGSNIMAQNEGNPTNVRVRDYKVQNIKNEFSYTIPAHSINAIEIEYEK